MLTARASADKVADLDGGADDYLTKPFRHREACWPGSTRAVRRTSGLTTVNPWCAGG
jgi:DNA-binding response OmpR family regulator